MTGEPRRLLRPSEHPVIDLPDDTVLTQYGVRQADGTMAYRGGPRDGEAGLSLIGGLVDSFAAALLVRQHSATPLEYVRHTRVGYLREEGFVVSHDPGPWNALHVLVQVPRGAEKWKNGEKKAFRRAFARYAEEAGDDRS